MKRQKSQDLVSALEILVGSNQLREKEILMWWSIPLVDDNGGKLAPKCHFPNAAVWYSSLLSLEQMSKTFLIASKQEVVFLLLRKLQVPTT